MKALAENKETVLTELRLANQVSILLYYSDIYSGTSEQGTPWDQNVCPLYIMSLSRRSNNT